jgi:hypothetical protein
MSFLAPLAFIAAAIVGPIIVAMYLLKLRREDRVVSSTFLWQRMVRDVEANAPWQKLRPNLLLLLQLLILLLLILALARPFFHTQGIAGRNLILIIDRSASMGATDVAPSRLAAAREQAINLVGQLPDGGRATVIAAGGQMEVPASATTDRRELRNAINSIELRRGGGSNLSQPLALAAALAGRELQSEVAIISDGNVAIPADFQMPAPVRYFPIGRDQENVALNALALQPSAAGQVLFAQAINYGAAPVTRRLDVYLDGELFNAYNLSIQPGREQSIVAEVPAEVETAEVRLDGEDVLPLDDRAWAVSVAGEAAGVRVVGAGNHFLETGLDLLPGVRVVQEPASWSSEQESEDGATSAQVPVTIFDEVVPETLPAGNLLFIAPQQSTDFFSVTGEMEFPSLYPAPGDEPLLRNVSLSEVSVLQAVRLVSGGWARVVVDSDGAPLLVAGEYEGRRIVVLAFALHQSDLPLQVAFPLLLSNIISYLSPGSGAEASLLAPGQPLALQVDPAITEVRITRPDGSRVSSSGGLFEGAGSAALRIQNGQLVYAETDMPGVYMVEEFKDGDLQARHRYAVNLFSPEESKVAPQDELAIEQASGLQTAITRERAGKQEFWRWLAALALLVVIVEWLVYHKNGFVYLRERWKKARADA